MDFSGRLLSLNENNALRDYEDSGIICVNKFKKWGFV
jgi:hypothetical protein